MSKITLDRAETIKAMEDNLENGLHEDAFNMLFDIAEYFENKYSYFAKEIMFDLLKHFSRKIMSESQNEFNYMVLLTVLNRLYPKEFQKELLKHD
jgi:hypothetical protein